MTLFATDTYRMSHWLKDVGVDRRYVLEARDVTVVAGMRTGAVMTSAGVLCGVGDTGDFIVADERVVNLAPGVHSLVCLVRGYAIVALQNMQYDTDVTTDAQRKAIVASMADKFILTSDIL